MDKCAADVAGRFEVFPADVRDPQLMHDAVRYCEAVIHLAALIAIPFSYHSPDSYLETNIKGTLNLLQASRQSGVRRFVQISTSEVYGTARFVPITEEHPLQGQSPYAATKIAADQLALSFYRSFGLPVVVARPFNTYGPRQSARAVIPTIISQIASGKRRIRLGAVSPTRDFNYVADTVAGLRLIVESGVGAGEVYNLGSNYEISVGDTARLIAKVMNVEIAIDTDEQRVRPAGSEVERLWAENAKARGAFGWTPAYASPAGFERGLAETAAWFADPKNLQAYKADLYNV